MALKPFVPTDASLTSSEAFKTAVENQFGARFQDYGTEDWEELFRQYHEETLPNNVVEVSYVTSAGQADLHFNVVSQRLPVAETPDQVFHTFPKTKMKPKPLD